MDKIRISDLEAVANKSLAHSENIGEEAWYVAGELRSFANRGANGMNLMAEADDCYIASLSPAVALRLLEVAKEAIKLADAVEAWNRDVESIIGRVPNSGMGTAALRSALEGIEL